MTRSLSLGLFGKAPYADDFIRVGAAEAVFSSFDAWLVSAVERAHRAGADWQAAFESGAAQAFVFRQPGAERSAPLLAGAMAPSRDRAGRRFPLIVGAPFSADAYLMARPELMPIALESVWQKASELVTAGREAEQSDFERRVEIADVKLGSAEDAERTYQSWIEELPSSELWVLLYSGDAEQRAVPEQTPARALRLLSEAIRPLRGIERPTTPLSAWLPLGQAGGAAVCFWLDLVKRMADWRETVASYFWSHDGVSGKMLLHLGEPPRTTAEQLWLPSRRRDEFFDLTGPLEEADVTGVPELSPELARCMQASAPLAELLTSLHGE